MANKVSLAALKRLCLIGGIFFLAMQPVVAQHKYDGEFAYLQTSGKNALFSVRVNASKEGDLEEHASVSLLHALMTEGVAGFNSGKPLIDADKQSKAKSFMIQFFEGQHKGFVEGAQREDGAQKNTAGQFRGSVYILIRHDQLMRTLEKRGYRSSNTGKTP